MADNDNSPWTTLDINIMLMCVLMSYAIGANNACNSWSTAYCTRILTLPNAVL